MEDESVSQSKNDSPLFSDIASMVGLGAYWAWGICVAIGEHPLGLTSYPFSNDSLSVNVAFKLLFALVILLLAPKASRFLKSSACFWATLTAAFAGSLLAIAPISTIAQLFGNALVALANILLLQRWMLAIWATAQRPYAAMLVAAPLCFTLVLIVQSLPQGLSDALACLLPILSLSLQLSAMPISRNHSSGTPDYPTRTRRASNQNKPRTIQIVAFAALVIASSFPLSYYKYALDLSGNTIWCFVIGCSLLLTIILAAVGAALERVCRVSHPQSYPIPLFILFLGIVFVSAAIGPLGPVAAGAFVYAGDYLCRACLYAFAFSFCGEMDDVTRRTSLATVCMLAGHIVGLFMGNAAAAQHQTSIMAGFICAALFGVAIVALPIINRLPGSAEATADDPLATIEEAYRQLAQQARERYGLTEREADVYALLLQGMNAAMIAARLDLSQSTVKSHLDRMYKKAGVHTREELVERVHKPDGGDAPHPARTTAGRS